MKCTESNPWWTNQNKDLIFERYLEATKQAYVASYTDDLYHDCEYLASNLYTDLLDYFYKCIFAPNYFQDIMYPSNPYSVSYSNANLQ